MTNNPNSEYDFDLFVIGAGSGGVRASRFAAQFGARVAVAEDTYLGGTCVNVGCVPKKLFVYGSELAQSIGDMAGFGLDAELKGFNWTRLRDNKTREIERLNGIYGNILAQSGVTLIEGRAKITGRHDVEVNGQTYTADKILIATGGKPFVPEIPGKEFLLNSDDMFYLKDFPESIIIVGGGYIAVEFAGIMNGLGVETHLLYRRNQILRGFDQEVRDFAAEQISATGIHIHNETHLLSVTQLEQGKLSAQVETGGESRAMLTDAVLMATGRVPRIQDLGLESVGVNTTAVGAVEVNDRYQSSVDNIYAIGDVIDKVTLTPVALAEGMFVARQLFDDIKPEAVEYENIATAVFSQPNIATLGLNEEQCRDQYEHVKVFCSKFKPMKHTMTGKSSQTFMKLLVCGESDRILGIHMVGPDSAEIMQGLAVAVKAGATKKDFDRTIGIHPTAAEEFVTMRTVTREHKKG